MWVSPERLSLCSPCSASLVLAPSQGQPCAALLSVIPVLPTAAVLHPGSGICGCLRQQAHQLLTAACPAVLAAYDVTPSVATATDEAHVLFAIVGQAQTTNFIVISCIVKSEGDADVHVWSADLCQMALL